MDAHVVIALGLLAAILVAGYAVRAALARRTERMIGTTLGEQTSLPTILYFTTPNCAPCRLQQAPALEALRGRVGPVFRLETVDIAIDPATAQRYSILTAPTTIVLDVDGTVRAINAGVASAEKLAGQLQELDRETRAAG